MKCQRLIPVEFEPADLRPPAVAGPAAPATGWRRRVPGGLLVVLLAVTLSVAAQDTNAPVPANGAGPAEELTAADAAQTGEAAREEDTAGTNTVSETNIVATPGPDGRARRRSRQAQNQNRAQAKASALTDTRSASSGTNAEPGRLDYSAFRLIVERNIFDPNRVAHSGRPGPPPKTLDAFTLVGTMSYEKGIFAFFDGTSADYKKVVKPDESIAGYKVEAISSDAVKLVSNTNVLQLSIGTQMRRREDGTWERSATTETYAASSTSNSSSSDAAAASGAESDVIKKMMMRREKE